MKGEVRSRGPGGIQSLQSPQGIWTFLSHSPSREAWPLSHLCCCLFSRRCFVVVEPEKCVALTQLGLRTAYPPVPTWPCVWTSSGDHISMNEARWAPMSPEVGQAGLCLSPFHPGGQGQLGARPLDLQAENDPLGPRSWPFPLNP